MKKLISILLIVTMLALSLCSCELIDKIFGTEEETTTEAEETTTKKPEDDEEEEETTTQKKPVEEETTTKPQEEETTTKAPWKPGSDDKDDKKPIELPGVGVKPTIGQ